MYLFFYTVHGLNALMGVNPLLGPLKGVGPENRDFLGLKWQREKRVAAPSNSPCNEIAASKTLCPVPYKQQVIVKVDLRRS